ncbi:MAG: hydrolase, family domain protein [Proteobacteria bacterium]|nr:hydrolase, family domain protein [Pseudomonadota bacterium]
MPPRGLRLTTRRRRGEARRRQSRCQKGRSPLARIRADHTDRPRRCQLHDDRLFGESWLIPRRRRCRQPGGIPANGIPSPSPWHHRTRPPIGHLFQRLGFFGQGLADLPDFLLIELFDADEFVLGRRGKDQFVELRLQRLAVAILGTLQNEHHQEGNDGGRRVDDELPGFGEGEERSSDRPNEDQRHGNGEGRGPARQFGNGGGKFREETRRSGTAHDHLML